MMTSAEGEYIAPIMADSSSTASGKEKEDPVEDDDLYCIDGAFVFFQVAILGLKMHELILLGRASDIPRPHLSLYKGVAILCWDVPASSVSQRRCRRFDPPKSHHAPQQYYLHRFSQLFEGVVSTVRLYSPVLSEQND